MTEYVLGNNLKVESASTGFGSVVLAGDVASLTIAYPTGTATPRDTTLPDVPGGFGDYLTTTGGATETLSWTPASALGLPTFSAYIIRWRRTTSSGTFTSGSWVTRPLNNRQRFPSTGTDVQLAVAPAVTDQMLIVDGVYYIEAFASANSVDSHQTRFRNITDVTTEILGSVEYANATQTYSKLVGVLTVTGGPKVYEFQHRCSTTKTNDGFGVLGTAVGGVDTGNSTQIYISFIKLV